MKSKYYISILIENNSYVGKVYSSSNNQIVYASKPYDSQDQAMRDVRTFVVTSAPPTTEAKPQRTVTSTTTYRGIIPTSHGTNHSGRCCGR